MIKKQGYKRAMLSGTKTIISQFYLMLINENNF
jgi:hypothetical protein